MWWGIGGGLLYLVVLLTLGLATLKRGHGWMFFFGIFLPLLWFIGAFIPRTEAAAAERMAST
jgi:ABC-type multidrug transport system permease subunit